MNIPNSKISPSFNARCPEVRLGQDTCHLVNSEFQHFSAFRFSPWMDKGIAQKVVKPKAIMDIRNKFCDINPNNYDTPLSYFPSLFDSIMSHHCFNCHESALLSELILKLNGIKNAYTASLNDGDAKIKHVVCFFNRDGSEITVNDKGKVNIVNNKTIIIDPWTGICDFANNVFNEYKYIWINHLKPILQAEETNGEYGLINMQSTDLPEEFLSAVGKDYPNLRLSNIPQ